MADHFALDETFARQDFRTSALPKGEYEKCVFESCNFEGADLSEVTFLECEFASCDLSNANLNKTAFKSIRFDQCKMMGLQFNACNPFLLEFSFDECQLNFSSFYGMKLTKTAFAKCILHEVDMADSDFSNGSFIGCDLHGAQFDNTNLKEANFTEAVHYSIDPELNNIQGAVFSKDGLTGLLEKYRIRVK